MGTFKFVIKAALVFAWTGVMAVVAFFIIMPRYHRRFSVGPRVAAFYARGCMRIFRVHVERADPMPVRPDEKRGVLVLANHTSFLDGLIMAGLYETVFVSKAEVRGYPIIGFFAALTGTVFLERESQAERAKMINTLARNLPGRMVAVFPQGTTRSSAERYPFHRGVFKIVELNPDVVIVPVTIVFKEEAAVTWRKGDSLFKTARIASALDRINIKIVVHKPVTARDYEGTDATGICRTVQETVMGVFA